MRNYLFFLCFIVCSFSSFSQKGVTTFGLQYKPLVPITVLNVENLVLNEEGFTVSISSLIGHNFGAVIRWGFTNTLALETGLNYSRRNFNLDAVLDDTLQGSTDFGIVTYEIPIQGLFYVRLSKTWYMNAATGFSMNFRASDVGKFTENRLFSHTAFVRGLNLAYVANLGFEYRSKKSGTFYLGASLSTPFRNLATVRIFSETINNPRKIEGDLEGNYLSVDLRYFFNENKKTKANK